MKNILTTTENAQLAEEAKRLVVESLKKAFMIHESLGASGEDALQENRFGENTLRIDMEIERSILDFLKESDFPIRVISEEHGTVGVTENPMYLGILDGLDGSNLYKRERGTGRYGTMLGIFSSLDPSYNDYLASGVMEHATGRLFIASKNGGAFVIHGNDTTPIHSSGKVTLDEGTRIYLNTDLALVKEVFSDKLKDFKTECADSTATYYVDAASGAADVVLECTHKDNLEIAAAYGLLTEAGAVTVDMVGDDIGAKKYLEFGQTEQLPIITASTKELALRLLECTKLKQ